MEIFKVCGVKVSAVNIRLACDIIIGWILQNRKTYVCVVPASTIVECQSDPKYHAVVNAADMATPDGMPLVWIGRRKGFKSVERTYGPDLMLEVCRVSEAKGFKNYFYGSTTETCQRLELKLKKKFPNLNIVGTFSPPFRPLSAQESDDIIGRINSANPQILWIGLGSPKQDFWMSEFRDSLNVPVMIGVGAAFDFLSGVKLQAPQWMRKNGLEWIFRFCCEPRRLWKRYLVGNAKFIYYAWKDLVNTNTD